MSGPSFFTCIGAQKAGTSWLQNYLNNSGEVYTSKIKEMHFFDSLCLPKSFVGDFWIKAFEERSVKALKNGNYELAKAYIERLEIGFSLEKYKSYFIKNSSGCKAFGDITPAYSMLDVDGFKKIRKAFPAAKIIFLMRNPVDRYWSYLRMQLKKNEKYPIKEKFYDVIGNEHVQLRSNYERTITCLESVFSSNQLLYIFYEDLFEGDHEACLNKINSFLGLKHRDEDFLNKRINASKQVDIDDDMRKFAARNFSNVYEYVESRFGRIPVSWEKDKSLL